MTIMTSADIIIHLTEREAIRRTALVNRDFGTLAALFADDLVYVHSVGSVQDKPAYLAYVQGPMSFVSIERGPLKIRPYGDIAVMTGEMVNTIAAPELPKPIVVASFVTQVWRDHGPAGWQMVQFQATRLPPRDNTA